MPHPGISATAEPCIWMSAGLLSYKLCDREFACERCPLDAALGGGTPENPSRTPLLAPSRDARVFPEDRLYTTGHSWIQAVGGQDGRLLRFGIDAFAAGIIGHCSQVNWHVSGRTLARGETVCRIDLGLGVLSVGVPLRGVLLDGNRSLRAGPGQLVTAPYADGWIVDLAAADPTELDGLLTAEAAGRNARLDLQRFRRRVALQLLADTGGVGRSLADGGELLVDLRQMLGGPTYLDLLRELIF